MFALRLLQSCSTVEQSRNSRELLTLGFKLHSELTGERQKTLNQLEVKEQTVLKAIAFRNEQFCAACAKEFRARGSTARRNANKPPGWTAGPVPSVVCARSRRAPAATSWASIGRRG